MLLAPEMEMRGSARFSRGSPLVGGLVTTLSSEGGGCRAKPGSLLIDGEPLLTEWLRGMGMALNAPGS